MCFLQRPDILELKRQLLPGAGERSGPPAPLSAQHRPAAQTGGHLWTRTPPQPCVQSAPIAPSEGKAPRMLSWTVLVAQIRCLTGLLF